MDLSARAQKIYDYLATQPDGDTEDGIRAALNISHGTFYVGKTELAQKNVLTSLRVGNAILYSINQTPTEPTEPPKAPAGAPEPKEPPRLVLRGAKTRSIAKRASAAREIASSQTLITGHYDCFDAWCEEITEAHEGADIDDFAGGEQIVRVTAHNTGDTYRYKVTEDEDGEITVRAA